MTYNPNLGSQQVYNMTLPQAPLIIPQSADLRTADSVDFDLSPAIDNQTLDYISGAWVDNSANALPFTLTVAGSQQQVIFPAGAQGYLPLLAPNNPKFTGSCPSSPGLIIPIIFYNVPLLPYLINTAGLPVSDSVSITGTVDVARVGKAYTNRSIANLSGSSQTLMAANAAREILIIQNVAANNIGVNLAGGTAAIGTAGTITLPAGASLTLDNSPPVGAITIIGTANDDVTAFEG